MPDEQVVRSSVPIQVNGETVILSIYKLSDAENSVNNTLWVFARD
jgi:hypothetical protein